ncbi:MAG: hypothetical protein KKE62_17250 [Proteobacteria bacterium]|nr:hypothetical protein [Pseudomonadota bacterium]MBU1386469.1 hypothetical protein [Pseudomonadota bacterium]MBU1544580.1 hypothetical protein [Pseudomonadota bacterium]MBU2481209.1 hypothetical protein [Pseudomonadota bacterium]
MNKREAIIVIIAVLITVYGLLDYLVFSNSGPSDQLAQIETEKARANDLAITAQAQLQLIQKATQSSDLPYLLRLTQSAWENDPFVQYDANARAKKEKDKTIRQDIPQINYTGFVQAGNNLMAIINGMEYMVGETIKDIGYKILNITPTRTRLLTDANTEIILLIKEN